MCGIAGLYQYRSAALSEPRRVLAMAERLRHRGPDDGGSLLGELVAFGFRRLEVIDLETGSQPQTTADGRVQVMLNGEIYNYLELRDELRAAGHQFRTNSDTEVIALGFVEWGIDVVQHLRGMFAIALWDDHQRQLILARDRMGQKPLFWGLNARSSELAFASEIKALLPWNGLSPSLDTGALDASALDAGALDDYLTFLYVPGPKAIFKGVHKLPPAHLLIFKHGATEPEIRCYWQPDMTPINGRSRDEWADELRECLGKAVRLRLRSDVPLGCFLSGGVDSTIIAGLAAGERRRAGTTLSTFSLGFADPRFDESSYARQTATDLGTEHHEETLDASSFEPDELYRLVEFMDEPFADSSFLPTYWLSRMARRHVTVALSGDGGDELFAGYHRYRTYRLLEKLARWPKPVTASAAAFSQALSAITRGLAPGVGERLRQAAKAFAVSGREPHNRVLALLTYFGQADKDRLYQPAWTESIDGSSEQTLQRQLDRLPLGLEPTARFMARDLVTNMVDDALVKVDRASMACSLEVRSPLLDHKVVELALRIPVEQKLAGEQSKAILRHAFADLLPADMDRRPKRGFEVPFGHWFQQPRWRAFLVDHLSEERIRRGGIFEPREVIAWRDRLLDDPEASQQPVSAYQLRHRVWLLLIFQIWCERFLESPSGTTQS